MKKRVLAILLATAMCFCAMPAARAAKSGPKKIQVYTPVMTDNKMAVLKANISFYKGERIKNVYFYYKKANAKKYTKVKSNPKSLGRYMKQVTGLSYNTEYVYYVKVTTNKKTYKSKKLKFTTPKRRVWSATDPIFDTVEEKYAYLFGGTTTPKTYKLGNPPPGYYLDKEARKHVISVTVPVWRIKNKKYISDTWTFKINRKLANNVKAIFSEIYDLRFPIADITTYKFRAIGGPGLAGSRSISKHSFGCAIDINRRVNGYYIGYDGRDKTSPYCLADEVVDVFKKYGWVWDGDAPKYVDTMHFQYLNDITVTP